MTTVERVFRDQWGDGDPTHPAAWLITTARNRAINRLRQDRTLAVKTHLLLDPPTAAHGASDDGREDEEGEQPSRRGAARGSAIVSSSLSQTRTRPCFTATRSPRADACLTGRHAV